MRFHGMNVVSCKVVTSRKRTLLIGAYPPPPYPSTLEHFPDLDEALTRFCYQYPIVLGDINANTGQA